MSLDEFRHAIRELWSLAEENQAKKGDMKDASTKGAPKSLRSVWSLAEGTPQHADTSVFVRFGRSVEFVL